MQKKKQKNKPTLLKISRPINSRRAPRLSVPLQAIEANLQTWAPGLNSISSQTKLTSFAVAGRVFLGKLL